MWQECSLMAVFAWSNTIFLCPDTMHTVTGPRLSYLPYEVRLAEDAY